MRERGRETKREQERCTPGGSRRDVRVTLAKGCVWKPSPAVVSQHRLPYTPERQSNSIYNDTLIVLGSPQCQC